MITIVSGLPHSGTSLMMRMLEAGGVPVLTDNARRPDDHNPYGYYEYAPVRRLKDNSAWLARQTYMELLSCDYNRLIQGPDEIAASIVRFLQVDLNISISNMIRAVDINLA